MDLKQAATKLADADKDVRDQAMAAVLQAKSSAVPYLVDALTIPGAPIAKIALLLAALGSRDGLPRFFELLDKNLVDLDTRAVIARALGELLDGRDAFDDSARRSVLRLSKDGHTVTRQLTVKALAKIGDKECVDRLREMSLADSDAGAKKAAKEAYAPLAEAMAAAAALLASAPGASVTTVGVPEAGGLSLDLEAAVRLSSSAAVAVADAVPDGPFKDVVLRLRDPRYAVRNPAVEDAVAAGKAIVPALLDVLTWRNPSPKVAASQALARIQAPEAARPLLDAIVATTSSDDDARQFRAIGLKALACSLTGGEEGMAQPLLPLTRDADPFVRAGALLCLGRLADRVGARAATLALTDPHDHVKEAAAVALSEGTREEDQDLVLPLLAVLGGMPSPGVAVREAILLALARIHVEDAGVLLRLRHRVRPAVLGVTSSLRRTALVVLERCYQADDPPPIGIVDDVLGRLADDHPEVRLLAASFLANHLEPGMSGAVERLEDALDRAEPTVSLLCLDALKRHDTPKAKLALEAAAEDPDEAVAARAKELLAGFSPTSAEWEAPPPPEPAAEPVAAPEPPPEAAVEAAGAAVEGDPSGPAPTERRAPEPEPEQPRRRVRPARGPGSGDVVFAKDAGAGHSDASTSIETSPHPHADPSPSTAFSTGRLRERLQAVKQLPPERQAAARVQIVESFAAGRASSQAQASQSSQSQSSSSSSGARLKDQLAALAGLSDEEKRARRDAILNRF